MTALQATLQRRVGGVMRSLLGIEAGAISAFRAAAGDVRIGILLEAIYDPSAEAALVGSESP